MEAVALRQRASAVVGALSAHPVLQREVDARCRARRCGGGAAQRLAAGQTCTYDELAQAMGQRELWLHSFTAALESVLFPELVASPMPLSNAKPAWARTRCACGSAATA